MLADFLKDLSESRQKKLEKKYRCHALTLSIKREIRRCYVAVKQRRQRNIQNNEI